MELGSVEDQADKETVTLVRLPQCICPENNELIQPVTWLESLPASTN